MIISDTDEFPAKIILPILEKYCVTLNRWIFCTVRKKGKFRKNSNGVVEKIF